MKRIVFFDLDGTLCQGNTLVLGDGLVEAFDQLRENEVQPVIASGRSLYEVKELFQKLKIENFILAGGGYASLSGKTIINKTFSKPEIETILALTEKHDSPIGYFNQQGYAVTRLSERVKAHAVHMEIKGLTISPDFYQTNAVNYMNLYLDEQTEAKIDSILKKLVDRMRFSPLALTVSPKDVSKGKAVQIMLEQLSESAVETYAFGDNDNDVSMFQIVDHGIAMSDATEQLRNHATYVARSEQGVLEGLKYYGLISQKRTIATYFRTMV